MPQSNNQHVSSALNFSIGDFVQVVGVAKGIFQIVDIEWVHQANTYIVRVFDIKTSMTAYFSIDTLIKMNVCPQCNTYHSNGAICIPGSIPQCQMQLPHVDSYDSENADFDEDNPFHHAPMVSEPKNNDGLRHCHWCGAATVSVPAIFSVYDICPKCKK